MAQEATARFPIVRIAVRLKVGTSLMSGSDDPVFLGLAGPEGREFRLVRAKGRNLRRGSEDQFVLAAPGDPDTNVAHPEFNDPTNPPLDAERVTGVYLRKGFDPIPNVRAVGEMDDRLEVVDVEVEIHASGRPKPTRYCRSGPHWLGLVAGLRIELAPVEDGA